MKLITKKLWVFVAMLCTLISASAYDFYVDGIYYNISSEANKEVSVTRGDNKYSGFVNIPASVSYNGETYTVKSIGFRAFYNCSKLHIVTIPNSVTTIAEHAFYLCTNLCSLTIGAGIEDIGVGAFSDATNTNIDGSTRYLTYTIPKVIWLGNTRPNGYREVEAKVNYVSNYEFRLSNQIVYPFLSSRFEVDNIVYIPVSQAEGTCDIINCNYSAVQITIPETVSYNDKAYKINSIGNYAFIGSSNLQSVTISNSVTTIGDGAFYRCVNLESLTIGSGVTNIGSNVNSYTISKVIWLGNTRPNGYKGIYASVNYVPNKEFGLTNQVVYPFLSSLFEVDNVVYVPVSQTEGTCDIIDCNYGASQITIPETVTHNGKAYKINNICEHTFYGSSNLQNVTIPNSVTTIGDYTFSECSNLQSVTIPNSVTTIGSSTFSGCSNLQSVTIPNSVTTIGYRTFYGCTNLQSLTIGSGVKDIGEGAFSYKYSNEKYYAYTIPKVIWLGNTRPDGYNEVKASVNYVSNNEFGLSNQIVYPFLSSRFEVGNVVYVPVSPSERTCDVIDCNYAPSSTEIVIDSIVNNRNIQLKVLDVNAYSFYKNPKITSLKISNSGPIYSYAFYNCDALESVTASNNGLIGKDAFYECKSLKTADLSNKGYVGNEAFYNCDALESVTASNNGYIGESAFDDCDALKSVVASNNGYIGLSAFYSCDALETAVASNNGYIGGSAFSNCKSLKTADLSNKGDVGSSAFYNCSSLETATLNINGVIGESCFENCAKLSSVKIGAQVTKIGDEAFANNTSLPEIIIPDNITSLGSSTFIGCNSLANVTIGKGINTLPSSLFSGCKSLASIVIPNNINSIGNNVFNACSNLGDVTIEEGVSTLSLGSNGSSPLFSSCKLDEVFIGRKLSYSTSSSSGYSPFYRNTSLRSVTITNAETQIYDNEFYGCSNLQEFACGNGITSIGQRAFSGCSALKTYSSGSKVESIGAEAFSDCTALTSFTSYAAVPPTCGTQALDDINKWECTLHVPSESIDDYQAAPQWKDFFYIDEASGIEDIAVDNSQATVKIEKDGFYLEGSAPVHVSVFSIDGKTCLSSVVAPHQTITLPTGLYIVKLGNKTMKIKI